jgi:hypothetical protein
LSSQTTDQLDFKFTHALLRRTILPFDGKCQP